MKNLINLFMSFVVGMLLCYTPNTVAAGSDTKVFTVEQLSEKADSLLGERVAIQGFCVHVCGKAGGKIFLIGDNERKRFRVQATKECSFSNDCLNSELSVTGILKEDRLDEAFLLNWEASVAKEEEENDHEHEHSNCTGHGDKAEAERPDDATRIAQLRDAISKRTAKEGKAYVSFYYIDAEEYQLK